MPKPVLLQMKVIYDPLRNSPFFALTNYKITVQFLLKADPAI